MAKFMEASFTGDLDLGMDRLAAGAGEALLRAGGFAGAAVFAEEARRRVPVDTGTIRDNIIVKRIEEKSNGAEQQTYYVTVRTGKHGVDGDAYYWRWVEFGHSFVRRKKKGTTWKVHRAAMKLEYGSSTAPAQPFIRPAYESVKGRALQAMRDRMAIRFKELMRAPQ